MCGGDVNNIRAFIEKQLSLSISFWKKLRMGVLLENVRISRATPRNRLLVMFRVWVRVRYRAAAKRKCPSQGRQMEVESISANGRGLRIPYALKAPSQNSKIKCRRRKGFSYSFSKKISAPFPLKDYLHLWLKIESQICQQESWRVSRLNKYERDPEE